MTEQNLFTINIRDLAHKPGEMREIERAVPLTEAWGEALAQISSGQTIDLEVRLESVHEGILVTANADTTMHAECGRCLTQFSEPLNVEFTELFAYTPTEADEYGVHGDHVNLEPPLRDAVVLALPFQPVCRPDCPGLDPVTGQLQNTGEGAGTAKAIDPRWAALAEFTVETDHGSDDISEPESK